MTSQTAAARAESLPLQSDDADTIADMYLTFDLGSEEYGIGIAGVTEIVGIQKIMPIPDMPRYVRGVINLRGKIIPLMDLRMRFAMEERPHDDRTVIIVMEVEDAPIGLIVDGVREVLEIPASQIDRHAPMLRGGSRPVISGIGRVGERVAVLLDPPVLVSDVDLTLVQEAGAA